MGPLFLELKTINILICCINYMLPERPSRPVCKLLVSRAVLSEATIVRFTNVLVCGIITCTVTRLRLVLTLPNYTIMNCLHVHNLMIR